MATYAIGDVQGCYESLRYLLEKIDFDHDLDRLWFVGDLVNRGRQSLETLRFVRGLGGRANSVLGNHDLHLLAIFYGGHQTKKSDTLDDVLQAPDCEQLADWLRTLPLMHEDEERVMVHAGIPHIWDLRLARLAAREVETVVGSSACVEYFENMYGNSPERWRNSLVGMDRHRAITNCFTRMRLISQNGTLDFTHKGKLADVPEGYAPWFRFQRLVGKPIVFGHWAALDGVTGLEDVSAIDTGCVWGRNLTALRLEDGQRFQWPESS